MLYKELLDSMLLAAPLTPIFVPSGSDHAILPTEIPFSFEAVWAHLSLNSDEPFSDDFVNQSRAVISGNGLRFGAGEARTLAVMSKVWEEYVLALGLGSPSAASLLPRSPSTGKEKANDRVQPGRTDDRLDLVYRRAGPVQEPHQKRKGKRRKDKEEDVDEEELVQLAIEASLDLPEVPAEKGKPLTEMARKDREQEEDEIACGIETSLCGNISGIAMEEGGEIILRSFQRSLTPTSLSLPLKEPPRPEEIDPESDPERSEKTGTSGSIIGRHRFSHSPRLLAAHLSSVLDWWLGRREAVGVKVEQTSRCGWCEFEEGCEWR